MDTDVFIRSLLFAAALLLTRSPGVHSTCSGCPSFSSLSYTVSVAENVTIGSLLSKVSATDPDSDPLQYGLTAASEEGFVINATTGAITLAAKLDFESKSSHVLTVTASDGTNTATSKVTVTVLDSPEYHVHCTPALLYIPVTENSPTSNTSQRLNCSDPDYPAVTFAQNLQSHHPSLFSLDELYYIQLLPLDYEVQQFHTINVSFTDTIGNMVEGNAHVFIEVLPVNEYQPEFHSDAYKFSVAESAHVATTIGQVEAVDHDKGLDGELRYSLTSGNGTLFFTINSRTGDIISLKPLNYESNSVYSFVITSEDKPLNTSNQLTSTATITVDIVDENDNAPVFLEYLYTGEVAEDVASLTTVLQVQCNDSDSGINSRLTYSIVGNATAFTVDTTSGHIKVATGLNYEDTAEYLFRVRCEDGGTPVYADEAEVLITVLGTNEYHPTCTSVESYLVLEGTAIGTELGQLKAVDGDSGAEGKLKYDMEHTTNCPKNVTQIDPESGKVYLTGDLDYESPLFPAHKLICPVEVTDGLAESYCDFILTIGNINDNKPQCDPIIVIATIPENLPTSSTIASLSCTDQDSSELNYTVVTNNDMFSINTSDSNIELVLSQPLDYESLNRYEVHVSVSDEEHSTAVHVIVTVSPVNEYAPIFTMRDHNCSVSELASPGTIVCNVTATDDDSGLDGLLQYTLSTATDYFNLDPFTGALHLIHSLDYEVDPAQFSLIVAVEDRSVTAVRNTSTNLKVNIIDENDNTPIVSTVLFSISENASVGDYASTVVCSDADSGSNGDVSLTIIHTKELYHNGSSQYSTFPPFTMNSSTGDVYITSLIDYEVTPLYQLTIECRDSAVPQRSITSTLTIIVEPENEFPPQFLFPIETLTLVVNHDEKVGSTLLSFEAMDDDKGVDGEIVYSLNQTSPNQIPEYILFLTVQSHSGELSLVATPTCAYGNHLTYQIIASDRGTPPLTATSTMEVMLMNCGVLPPHSSSYLYTAEVSESAENGTSVVNMSCTSPTPDLLPAGSEVEYRFQSASTEPFAINGTTGEVTLAGSGVNYEAIASHVLAIVCQYSHDNYLNSTLTVYVQVLPENEHSPVFKSSSNITIAEDTTPGSRISSVLATDEDSGDDGKVEYSINTSGPFAINRQTGDIYLVEVLDREAAKNITVEVIAHDNPKDSSKRRSTVMMVNVSVLDVNDNQPHCQELLYTVSLLPQTSTGTPLLSLDCTDSDDGANAQLQYSLANPTPDDIVSVQADTGIVELSQVITSSSPQQQTVTITVEDSGTPALSTTVYVFIALNLTTEQVTQDNKISDEGVNNTVNITISRVAREMWHDNSNAAAAFKDALASIITSHCALQPETCSLLSGCSTFFSTGSKSKRQVGQYIMFSSEDVVITGVTDSASEPNTLVISAYVVLPEGSVKSPFHTTDHVVPQVTLSETVTREQSVIGAVVRDVTAGGGVTPLTSDWMYMAISMFAMFAVIVIVALVVLVVTRAHKNITRRKNAVVPVVVAPSRLRGPHVSTTSSSSVQQSIVDGCSLIDVSPPSSAVASNWSRKETILKNLRSQAPSFPLHTLKPPPRPFMRPSQDPFMRQPQDPFMVEDDTEEILLNSHKN